MKRSLALAIAIARREVMLGRKADALQTLDFALQASGEDRVSIDRDVERVMGLRAMAALPPTLATLAEVSERAH